MRRGDHLREVDERDLVVVADHQIELVEVGMDEAVVGQMHH